MARWLVAVNRFAGARSQDPATIDSILRALDVDFELIAPESRDLMSQSLVEGAVSGFTNFAVAGGDGTVNLAVNSLLPLGLDFKPTIAVLPTGTGCDLIRTFGLPQDLASSARHLTTADTYDIDVATLVGHWGTRYFVNVAQAGVGAAAAETAPALHRRLGAARYPLAFLARLPRFPPARITITTESRTIESDALAVIFANAQFFAGGWNVAPRATLVDGVLDVQVIDAKKRNAPALVPKVVKGTHLRERSVRRFSAGEYSLTTEPSWPVEADGDPVGNTQVTGRVVRAAISLKI